MTILELVRYHCLDEDCGHRFTDAEQVHFCPRCGSTSVQTEATPASEGRF